MHFFNTCILSEEAQGPAAEMLLIRVLRAYYHISPGFCIDIAGKSMEGNHHSNCSTKRCVTDGQIMMNRSSTIVQ